MEFFVLARNKKGNLETCGQHDIHITETKSHIVDDYSDTTSCPDIPKVCIDLRQFPSPFSPCITAVTRSKFQVSLKECNLKDKDVKTLTEKLTESAATLFLNSLPRILSIPYLSFSPIVKPWNWKLKRFPLFHVTRVEPFDLLTPITRTTNNRYSDSEEFMSKVPLVSNKTVPTLYCIESLWPRITLAVLSFPYRSMPNSAEYSIDICIPKLFQKTSINSFMHSMWQADFKQLISAEFTTQASSEKILQQVTGVQNKHLVFDVQYLGLLSNTTIQDDQSQVHSKKHELNTSKTVYSDSFKNKDPIAVFHLRSRIQNSPMLFEYCMLPSISNNVETRYSNSQTCYNNSLSTPHLNREKQRLLWLQWSRRQIEQVLWGAVLRRFHQLAYSSLSQHSTQLKDNANIHDNRALRISY